MAGITGFVLSSSGFVGTGAGVQARSAAVCGAPSKSRTAAISGVVVSMAYDMDGTGSGSLEPRSIKSSAVEKDSRCFKVTFVLPSQSRLYTFRELQNVYTTKMVPFSSWYAEQQRIQKMGGKILKVELVAGGQMRSVGNQ